MSITAVVMMILAMVVITVFSLYFPLNVLRTPQKPLHDSATTPPFTSTRRKE
jgi:hypothetical protein